MTTKKLLDEFRKLNLPDGEYAIFGSTPLAIRGIREARDLDVVVKDNLYDKLKEMYPQNFKKDRITIGKIEIFSIDSCKSKLGDLTGAIKRADKIQGLRFLNLKDTIEWKKKLNRPKDLKDIELIKKHLTFLK